MLFSSFSTRSMVFAYFTKAQLPFSLFRDLFNDTAEFTLCYGLHDCSPLFQGYFIHSLSTLYYYNAPSLATRLTGDYRDRTYTGKCSPALLDTHKKKAQLTEKNPVGCALILFMRFECIILASRPFGYPNGKINVRDTLRPCCTLNGFSLTLIAKRHCFQQ